MGTGGSSGKPDEMLGGVTLRWTDIPSGGGIVISRPVPIVLGNF